MRAKRLLILDCLITAQLPDLAQLASLLDGFQVSFTSFNLVKNSIVDVVICIARKPFRAFNSRHTLAVGLVGGFLYSLMRSTQRLVGLEPNDVEVARLGFIPSEILQETEKKREMRNLNMIDYKTAELSATKKDE